MNTNSKLCLLIGTEKDLESEDKMESKKISDSKEGKHLDGCTSELGLREQYNLNSTSN